MKIKFSVTEANLDAGYCTISVVGPDGVAHPVTVDTSRIALSSEDTEVMLSNTLYQIARAFIEQQYPLPAPKPEALNAMVGKTYEF